MSTRPDHTDAPVVLGIDFGTESGRALLVDAREGRELGSAVSAYSHAVLDRALPDGAELPPDFALQDPDDYLRVLDAVPGLLRATGVRPEQVIGVGTDFTACTVLPTLANGTPLCRQHEFRSNPHAWVKLWKHHAAQPQADRINQLGRERNEEFITRYGGRYSAEWLFSKLLETQECAPAAYRAAARYIEAADWIVWQLCGQERRNACTAGYKAMWFPESGGFPEREFFAALNPEFAAATEKLSAQHYALGDRAGGLTPAMAKRMGLLADTPVAVGNVDAHGAVPACTVVEPGRMVMIMGTSICHMLMGEEKRQVEGMCGVVRDGIIPGCWGYEAGQSAVGDIFAWFFRAAVPASAADAARAAGQQLPDWLEAQARRLQPGDSGLLALDWWNGNRSILVNHHLSGLLLGCTLQTEPAEIYRALLESTAYGTLAIIEAMEKASVPVRELVACGGLPNRNPLLMQIYADVTGREIHIAASEQTCALGAAMHAAVAAGEARGGYANIRQAARAMARLRPQPYRPDAAAHVVYRQLYGEYLKLHDYFGRGANPVMENLRQLRAERHAARAGRAETHA